MKWVVASGVVGSQTTMLGPGPPLLLSVHETVSHHADLLHHTWQERQLHVGTCLSPPRPTSQVGADLPEAASRPFSN